MNRHRANWSAMGIDEPTREQQSGERKRRSKQRADDKATIKSIIDRNTTILESGISYVVSLIKEIAEE